MSYGPLLLIFLVGGLLLGYYVLRREMLGQIAELRRLLDSERTGSPAAVSPVATEPPVKVEAPSKPKSKPGPISETVKPAPAKEEITAEILAIIAAAVAQFVGAGARIRSTRMLPVADGNAWAQQGRVIIQASHNLAMR